MNLVLMNPNPRNDVEHETKFSLKIFCSIYILNIYIYIYISWWQSLTSNWVMVMSSNHTGGNYVFYWNFLKPLEDHFCAEMLEVPDLCCKQKPKLGLKSSACGQKTNHSLKSKLCSMTVVRWNPDQKGCLIQDWSESPGNGLNRINHVVNCMIILFRLIIAERSFFLHCANFVS